MLEIPNNFLQITKFRYFELIEAYRQKGLTVKKSFYEVEDLCTIKGYSPRFSNFESFKEAYYSKNTCKK